MGGARRRWSCQQSCVWNPRSAKACQFCGDACGPRHSGGGVQVVSTWRLVCWPGPVTPSGSARIVARCISTPESGSS
eukprot:11163482-Lingulodinium_polyedra.AAC.1